MDRLQPWQFGFASAVTFSVFYAACALARSRYSTAQTPAR